MIAGARQRRGQGRGRGGPRRISRFVEPALLLLLSRGPLHGYALMDGLRSLGFEDYPVELSGLYRTLRSLEAGGMAASEWDVEGAAGPPRRVYTITPAGRGHLSTWVDELRATDRVLHTFLDAYDRDAAAAAEE